MQNESKYEPPKRNFKSLPFLLGALGLFLLVAAVDMLRARRSLVPGWTLATAALVLILLAVLWARRQD